MQKNNNLPLILGGHTFISQLGNDIYATRKDQLEIVKTCLDPGISFFDTTYQPERRALGDILNELKRRNEAGILQVVLKEHYLMKKYYFLRH